MNVNLAALRTVSDRISLACDLYPRNWHDTERTESLEGYLRSLGSTIGAILQGRTPGAHPSPGFTCVNREGQVEMRFRTVPVPVKSIHLRTFFFRNRIILDPGEFLVLDATLAKMILRRELDSCVTDLGRVFREAGRYDIPVEADTGLLGPYFYDVEKIRGRHRRLSEFLAAARLMERRRLRFEDRGPRPVKVGA